MYANIEQYRTDYEMMLTMNRNGSKFVFFSARYLGVELCNQIVCFD